jgi:hypothetical protein
MKLSFFFERNGKRFAVIFIRRSFNNTTEKRRVSVEQHSQLQTQDQPSNSKKGGKRLQEERRC